VPSSQTQNTLPALTTPREQTKVVAAVQAPAATHDLASHGWLATRDGACLVLGRSQDPVTATAAAALGAALNGWARDAEIYAVTYAPEVLALDGMTVADDAGTALAELIWRLDCFSKPIVSLATGSIGDVGLAFALAGTHRAFLSDTSCRIHATTHGRLPPGNVLQTISAIPRVDLRTRLLTGDTINAGEALAAGFATHVIAQDQLSAIRHGLAAADPVDPLLDDRALQTTAMTDHAGLTPATTLNAPLQRALAALNGASAKDALTRTCRYDMALQQLGPNATIGDLEAHAAAITVTLPDRKVLQAFRTASSASALRPR
jgi:enoyl-CoA hydratase/carnithine racemase